MQNSILHMLLCEIDRYKANRHQSYIVPNSLPIVWFGDLEGYLNSSVRIVTASLNPSNWEFRLKDSQPYGTEYRFPSYRGTPESLYQALSLYFKTNSYGGWFRCSFSTVLRGFDASHYPGAINTAIHTDVCSPYATDPIWSGLPRDAQQHFEGHGLPLWHKVISDLMPDVILYSASPNYESKIGFQPIDPSWHLINVGAKRPLLLRRFAISGKSCTICFQVQGRKPFLQTGAHEKLLFARHVQAIGL
jgi:hypothetical protein